ncbi:MAG: hypothetical protein LBG97_06015, partial [Coriobacteriales bacterium]|nr:hypothetical protein [Coriobacteriales bacterium]
NHDNLRATVIKEAGVAQSIVAKDPTLSAKSYAEVQLDSREPRKFYHRYAQGDGSKAYLQEYSVVGDAKDFSNWKPTKLWLIKYWYG